MSSPIRLLAVIEAATVTGPAKNLIDFCQAAKTNGGTLEAHLVTFERHPGKVSGFGEHVRQAGIELTVIPERGRFDRNAVERLKSITSQWKPHIVQTHAVKSHFLMALSGLWRKYPWVAFHHGYTQTDFKMRLYNELDRWSLRKPARLVTVSKAFERQLVARGVKPSRIDILQNAVHPEWIVRVRREEADKVRHSLGFTDGNEVILAVGRMSAEKAHDDLILAFALLRRDLPAAQLLLVGDGPERARLERLAGGGVHCGVHFIGQVKDVSPYFAVADVMVLPSLTEGSPNVLLEAMACGVASVATRVGGVPEIVTDGEDALLVSPRAPEELASAIRRVLTDGRLKARLIERALETIQKSHTIDGRAAALRRIYEDVRQARPAHR